MLDVERKLLENSAITQRLFLPRRTVLDRPFLIKCKDVNIYCHRNVVPNAKYTVVYFHGNGEVVSDYESYLPPVFERFGCNCLLAEYRGYGMSDGEANLINLIEDAEVIVPSLGIPFDRIILYGRSFGSLPAIHAASKFPGVHALVLESGIADLSDRIQSHWLLDNCFATDRELVNAVKAFFNHKEKLAGFHGYTAIFHCLYDKLVSPRNAHALNRWANEPKCFEMLYNGDHNSAFRSNLSRFEKVFRHLTGS